MEQLDDLLASTEVTLSDDVLDAIDEPGTDLGRLDMAFDPPAIQQAILRRRPFDERTAA